MTGLQHFTCISSHIAVGCDPVVNSMGDFMKKETAKMNQGVVHFLLNQNCIDTLYASATSEVMLSKSVRIYD